MNSRLFANPALFEQMQQNPGYQYGQALLGSAASTAPVRSPLEGVARALMAVPAGFAIRGARKDAEAQQDRRSKAYAAALMGNDPLAALSGSDDPDLQQTALQMRLQQQLNPQQDPLVKVFDQATGAEKWVKQSQAAGLQAAAPTPRKAPETRTVGGDNGTLLDQEFDPNTGQWKTVGSRSQFAPQQAPAPPEVLRLLQASGIDPKSPQGQAAIAHALGTDQKPQFGNIITGADAKALGLDPNGTYQQGANGKWEVISGPSKSTTFGPVITGQAAQAQGLDPNGSYQQGSDGKWNPVGSPKDDPAALATLKAMGLDPKSPEGKRMLEQNLAGAGNSPYKQENTLRDEYNALTKDFRTVTDAYNKIVSTSDTGAGDMSLLYSYVKLLDPGSVVRESEFATAAASGSFGQQMQGAVQRVMSGQRLPPTLRASFKDEAKRIYQGQKLSYDNAGQQYTDIANRQGANPQNVVIPYDVQAPGGPASSTDLNGLDVWQKYGLVPPPGYKQGAGQ